MTPETAAIWVMILLKAWGSGVTAMSQEFTSKDRCEAAGAALDHRVTGGGSFLTSMSAPLWVCVPK